MVPREWKKRTTQKKNNIRRYEGRSTRGITTKLVFRYLPFDREEEGVARRHREGGDSQ